MADLEQLSLLVDITSLCFKDGSDFTLKLVFQNPQHFGIAISKNDTNERLLYDSDNDEKSFVTALTILAKIVGSLPDEIIQDIYEKCEEI